MGFASLKHAVLAHVERRRHPRITHKPLIVSIGRHRYKTVDWSLGGFRLPRLRGAARPGLRLSGEIDGLRAARPGRFVAEVVHVTDDGEVGARFLEISPAFFIAMSAAAGG